MAVRRELEAGRISYHTIELGEVELTEQVSDKKLREFSENISALGFELIEDRKARIISKIKNTILKLIRDSLSLKKIKLSAYVSEAMHKDYDSLSAMFSEVEGITLEKYFIEQKIERVKELLVYDELSLSQIASDLGYSSVNHLSGQFKKVTGLTPTHFKKIGAQKRKSLDHI